MELIIFATIAITSALFFFAAIVFILLFKKKFRESEENKKQIIKLNLEIEENKKSIKNLSCLYESAIQYDKSITDFFSNITHDLKTPISVILGAIQLIDLKNKTYTEESSAYLKNYQIIRHNCYRLVRLANNILDFARLDSGYIKMNLSNCNIVYLIEEITQSVLPYAQQKQIALTFDTEHEEINTAVDIEKIERIILNLLSNAIKFTGSGGSIFVTLSMKNENVLISVKDTGIGIPEEKQKDIFERFHQVGSSLSKEYEGSGIGLSLVKSFIELHQGNIYVSSKEKNGSEFVIVLPIHHLEEHNIKTEDVKPTDRQCKITEAVNIEFSNSIAS